MPGDNVDKLVEIETNDGEPLVAKVILVFHNAEYDEHGVFYDSISTNKPEVYKDVNERCGYALDFENMLSVRTPANCGGVC